MGPAILLDGLCAGGINEEEVVVVKPDTLLMRYSAYRSIGACALSNKAILTLQTILQLSIVSTPALAN